MPKLETPIGKRVKLTWSDCCVDGIIKGTLEEYKEFDYGWPERAYYKIDGVGMLIGGADMEVLDE